MAQQFEALGFQPRLLQGIKEMGFEEMFPIQAQAITPILQGKDIIGQAHTGSGKTLAYALPILQRIDSHAHGLQALVLVPTRELAVQVAGEFERLARHLPTRTVPVYGGQSIRVQFEKLERPTTKIIVATPGRLIDHLERRTVELNRIRFVVLDEADRMLDMGFIDDVRLILDRIPGARQTTLFSATMPDEIVRLAHHYMKNPLRIFVDSDEIAVESVSQEYVWAEENEKFPALCSLIKAEKITRGLVFCSTKIRAGRLAQALRVQGENALAIHGDLSQSQRDQAIRAFRDGSITLLVATDVAARGLDITNVSHVINYDLPEEPLTYFHRIGRTARAGNAGIAISLVSRSDDAIFDKIRRTTSSLIREKIRLTAPGQRTYPRIFLPPRPNGPKGGGERNRQRRGRRKSGPRPPRFPRHRRRY
jgi:ATP-dependent RNA helicase DeaD